MLKTMLRLATTALFFALTTLHAQTLQPLATADDKAEQIFHQTNSTAMILVVVRDREVHFRSFGEIAPNSGQLPTPSSLLRLCSLTKTFATDLLVKLEADKLVRLDDPLQRFAPSKTKVPTLTIHGPAARPITLGDLATHTAGLPREIGPAPAGTPHFTFPDHAQRWAWLPRQRLRASPGTVASYSNVGFDLLGDALESAAHKPYAQLLAERTLTPLALHDTTFSPTPAQCGRLLLGYHRPRPNEPPFCTDTQASAGSAGLYSTPADMARYLQYLLGTSDIKQPAAAQAIYVQPSSLKSIIGLDHAGDPSGIGLGWLILDAPITATRIIEKTGGGGGFSTYIALDHAHHTAIFIALTEGGDWQTHPFRDTNDILLALSNLPPMQAEPIHPTPPRRKPAARKHPAPPPKH
jgi:D-alanyl-D-alanine-carboxypeptidase/D-alanyl-D-alanine-endopeptidase